MKKKFILVICTLFIALCLTACTTTTSKSYTFDITTGDKIKIELNTTGGYDLKQEDGEFYVEKDNQRILSGTFGVVEGWYFYSQGVDSDENAEVVNKTDSRIEWRYHNNDSTTEYDSVTKVSDKTVIITGGYISDNNTEAQIKEALSRLTFTVEE